MYRQLVVVLAFVVVLLPSVTWAQGFTNLVNIPGLEGEEGLREYLAAFFYLSIGIAALLAVVKLVIAGARYMLSDVANQKEAAKADIRGAVIGLLIILATYILLNTINTQILETDIALQPYEFPEIEMPEPDPDIDRNMQPGDARYNLTGAEPVAEKREICETIDTDECEARLDSFWVSSHPSCYQGEFFDGVGWRESAYVCIIRAENYSLPDGL